MLRRTTLILLTVTLSAAVVFGLRTRVLHRDTLPRTAAAAPLTVSSPAPAMTATQAKIVAGARAQNGDVYDAAYSTLPYPNGDPPAGRGACTDVVVRGLRAAGVDLQMLVHQDMKRRWNAYPHSYHLARPDPNIDHRRVPNLAVFFRRHGRVLPNAVTPKTLPTWQPGDVVCWKLPNGLDHTGLVSDRRDGRGIPLVIHNLDRCAEQDVLTDWLIAGHYRYPK